MAAPSAAVATFRAPLESALAAPQDVDKPTTYAAAEVMAGLLASGALFSAAPAGGFPAVQSDRRAVQAIGKIDRGADQGAGETGNSHSIGWGSLPGALLVVRTAAYRPPHCFANWSEGRSSNRRN